MNEPRQIKIVSWNILAASRAKDSFDGVTNKEVDWATHRLLLVRQELARADADVVALIEVEQCQYDSLVIGMDGYAGLYFPKPIDCRPLDTDLANHGIAVFYRIGEVLVDQYTAMRLPLSQEAVSLDVRTAAGDLLRLVVCHLKSKPENATMRAVQVDSLLQRTSLDLSLPTLLVGDFNDEIGSRCLAPLLSHFVHWWSPRISTWKSRGGVEVKRTIDHAFYTHSLYLLSSDETRCPTQLLPNASFPSDHIPLVLTIAWVYADF